MDVKTKNCHWLEADIRPTEELIRIWETRDLDIWSDDCLQSVKQVLAAREILNPTDSSTSLSWLFTSDEPVLEEFFIHQIKRENVRYIWLVKLKKNQAEFHCPVTGDHFIIKRVDSPSEINFQKTGFLMLRDNSRVIVQGKLFDLGNYYTNLLSWMPKLLKKRLIEIQHRWGITLLIAGSLSLLLSTVLIPVWGCVLIGLGLVNLLWPGKALFLLNGLCLMSIGSLNVFTSMASITSSNSEQIVTTAFWMLFGLWLMIWGGIEINELRKYRGLTL